MAEIDTEVLYELNIDTNDWKSFKEDLLEVGLETVVVNRINLKENG